jgi:hypothetical protein
MPAVPEVGDDLLDVDDGDGVDACEGLVEEDERRVGGQGAADLQAAPLSSRQRIGGLSRDVADAQLLEELARA